MDIPTIAGLAIGAAGTIFAGIAAIFSAKAPSRKDLKRVESHVKSVDVRLQEQRAHEEVEAAARGVPISVQGEQEFSQPLKLSFDVARRDARLVSVDLLNEARALFGRADCTEAEPSSFTASIDNAVARNWYNGGETAGGSNRKLLVMGAHLVLNGQDANREFAVYITQVLAPHPQGGHGYCLRLEGHC